MELDLMGQLERREEAPPVVPDSSAGMDVGLEFSLGWNSGDVGSSKQVQVSDEEVEEEKKGKMEDGIVQYGLQVMPVVFQQPNGCCYACMVPCWVPCSSADVENSLNRDLVVEMNRVVAAGDWQPEVAGGSGSSSPGTCSSGTSVFQSFSAKGESSSSNESRSHSGDASLANPSLSSKSRNLMLGQKKSTRTKRRIKTAISPKQRALVSTRGADGEKVDGYLYECSDNRGVRILCECHRRFFSPAGFVRHAGGPQTLHPLRQITVAPS